MSLFFDQGVKLVLRAGDVYAANIAVGAHGLGESGEGFVVGAGLEEDCDINLFAAWFRQ